MSQCVFVPPLSADLINFQVSFTAELLKQIILASVIWIFAHRNVILITLTHSLDTKTCMCVILHQHELDNLHERTVISVLLYSLQGTCFSVCQVTDVKTKK